VEIDDLRSALLALQRSSWRAELLAPPKRKTAFGRRYLSLMQRDPGLVLEHAALTKQL
jgi:hypothetical protein